MSDSPDHTPSQGPDWHWSGAAGMVPAETPVALPATIRAAIPAAIPASGGWEGPPVPSPRRRRPSHASMVVVALMAVVGLAGFVVGGNLGSQATTTAAGLPAGAGPATDDGSASPPPSSSPSPSPSPDTGTSGADTAPSGAGLDAGVVDINTELGFQGARAAGTGMVLTASGEVLTNNHVVAGATRIDVTAVDTGRTYAARVVGTDPTEDVAVLQLVGASRLATVATAASSNVAVGDPVVAIGNAGGRGGAPSVVDGNVVALGQTITATDESGSNAERLSDLIEVDAPIEAGDSGGPLLDASGKVIGMDSAAEVSGTRYRSTTTVGYAIRIDKALAIADRIESGKASATVHIGLPAFLGVQLAGTGGGPGPAYGPGDGSAGTGGATVAGVEPGTAAASIGLAAGDTITSVNGRQVDSPSRLGTLVQAAHPGDEVSIGWVDQSGNEHTARATLTAGPAD